jgi:hypothetical protein
LAGGIYSLESIPVSVKVKKFGAQRRKEDVFGYYKHYRKFEQRSPLDKMFVIKKTEAESQRGLEAKRL